MRHTLKMEKICKACGATMTTNGDLVYCSTCDIEETEK